jgi:diketogulonate reductase-like aldo/keto reductase
MRGLEHCVEQGYTRFIGVSNFSSSLQAEAQSYLKEHRLVANQVEYSLIYQNPKAELLPYCQSKDVTLVAYTPLAKGRLAKPGNRTLDEMADKYGKTPAQISLNWLISQKKVAAIPKASKVEHLKDNIGALGWKLKREDSDRVERAFA